MVWPALGSRTAKEQNSPTVAWTAAHHPFMAIESVSRVCDACASEVTTIWRYTNVYIIIIIICQMWPRPLLPFQPKSITGLGRYLFPILLG